MIRKGYIEDRYLELDAVISFNGYDSRKIKPRNMLYQFMVLCRALFVLSISMLFCQSFAFAAEQVVLKYGIFRESISVEELSTFAETGELSRSLRVNFALARQDPKAIRPYLTTSVKINLVILDRVLNSPIGNVILDELSQVIHPPSRTADRQALRAALVLSASEDGEVTLLEIIENYPTINVEVDGERLENAYHQLRRLQVGLQDLLKF